METKEPKWCIYYKHNGAWRMWGGTVSLTNWYNHWTFSSRELAQKFAHTLEMSKAIFIQLEYVP